MLVLAIMTSLSFVSCHDDEEDDEVSVGMSSVNLNANGGSQSVPVASNTQWMVSGAPSWLRVSPMQGSKNGAFSISADKNEDSEGRSCMLIITAGKASAMIEVNQSGNTQPSIVGTWEREGSTSDYFERLTFNRDGTGFITSPSGSSNLKYTFSVDSTTGKGSLQYWFIDGTYVYNGIVTITGKTMMLTEGNSTSIWNKK